MNVYETNEYESEAIDSSEEDSEAENARDILSFCDQITEELRFCFRRNFGSDDYCEDVYEDKFQTPQSGSYSYYTDILAIAQLNENKVRGTDFAKCPDNSQKSIRGSTTIRPSNWLCSGQWNPSTGAGPLEELFEVLKEHYPESKPQNSNALSAIFPQEWATNPGLPSPYEEELVGISSIESYYPNFMDSIHRWNDESTTILSSAIGNNYMPYDYHSSY